MRYCQLLLFLLLAQGCGGAGMRRTAATVSSPPQAAARNIEIGDALEARGHHLEASFYYEAALMLAADESRVLPRLISAQVRAGRLRAASVNTQRLISLVGPRPRLTRLSRLLALYAPPTTRAQTEAAP